MFHKISNVKILSEKLLWIEFRDGSERVYDARKLVEKSESFRELLDNPVLFASVKVDAGGYGISWNDDFDLSAEELWENGTRIKDPVSPSTGMRHSTSQVTELSAFGMWADRADMIDPVAYVENLRKLKRR